jgi:tRNA threonylcarbamoyladenosine biosynthesis protein TsaB
VSGPLVLAIDSAFGPLSIAVARGGLVLAAEQGRSDLRAAEHLPGLVQEVLARAGLAMADVDRIAVTLGPGGFTSLRSGLAFAKGLAFGLGKPLLGFTTLQALALSCPPAGAGPLVVAIDAKRDEIFLQSFQQPLAALVAARTVAVGAVGAALPAGAFMVCGSGAALVLAAAPDRAQVLDVVLPSAAALATHACGADPELHPAEAVYLRPADARPMAVT